jgi:hypothetical protein
MYLTEKRVHVSLKRNLSAAERHPKIMSTISGGSPWSVGLAGV